jgi:DNA-binding beta-propeller fold protein YncE
MELNTAGGSLVSVVNAAAEKFNEPVAIAVSGSRVWVTNNSGDSVAELNFANGGLVRIFG